MIANAEAVFLLLFGEKWLPSVPLFQIFMLISLTIPLISINANIIKILGRSDVYRNLAFLRSGMNILALCVTASFSLEIIIWGQVIAGFIIASAYMYFCGTRIGFTFGKQIRLWLSILWKPFVAFLVAGFISKFITDLLWGSVVWFVLFCLLFLVLCIITNDKNFNYYKNIVLKFFK